MFTWISAGVLCLIAIAHSVLGAREVIGPLCEASWQLNMPRAAAERILKFAWHLTSLAWVCLASILLGLSGPQAVALCAFASAVMIFASLPGHFAWPLFCLVGAFALLGSGQYPPSVSLALIISAAVLGGLLASLHVYWAFGGKRWIDAVIPASPDGQPRFAPGIVATLAVAVALFTFGGALLSAVIWGFNLWTGVIAAGAALVLTLRAIGDGRQVGFSKADHSSLFERRDDAIYTPLCVWMAFGAASVWLL